MVAVVVVMVKYLMKVVVAVVPVDSELDHKLQQLQHILFQLELVGLEEFTHLVCTVVRHFAVDIHNLDHQLKHI